MTISEYSMHAYEYLISLGVPLSFNVMIVLTAVSALIFILNLFDGTNDLFKLTIGTLSIVILVMSYNVTSTIKNSYEVRIAKIPIYTLGNTNDIKGSFILGAGSIDTSHGYIAFIEKDGGYIKKILPEDSIIYQGEYSPHYEYNECYNKYIETVGPCEKSDGLPLEPKIFIPKNSIIQKYELN